MACCMCSFWGSKSWVAFVIPIFAVFACFPSGHEFTLFALLVLLPTLLLFTFSKQKVANSTPRAVKEFAAQESTVSSSAANEIGEIAKKKEEVEENEEGFLIESQESYSESESIDQFSSEEEDQSSDAEQRLDFSDDSISDEESLFEIAIPSGEFVCKDPNMKNLNYCKYLSAADFSSVVHQKQGALDFFTDLYEMNEEDNLIEIDIYMGSIKYSSYPI